MNREEQKQTIKDYLKRLGAGEELESVRVDFVKKFQSVDAAEIMNAEQELIKEGTPISEVQRLCDVHSALFHGKTREEQIANAPKATVDSIREQRFAKTAELVKIPGHPLHTFTLENEALAKTIKKCREALKNEHVEHKLIEEVRQLAIHYAKKGDLLYPHLKVKYEISGPSDVMWTVDDEIRDEFAALAKKADSQDDEWKKRFEAALTRADEMIYKEANILFPNCAFNFTDEEWFGIYRDSKDYAECFGVENGVWEDSSKFTDEQIAIYQDQINEAYEKFVNIVADGRDMSVEDVKKLADGRTYTAKQAKNNGLIDEISLYPDMKDAMSKKLGTSTFYEMESDEGLLQSLFSKAESLVPKSEAQVLTETAKSVESGVPMYYAEQLR